MIIEFISNGLILKFLDTDTTLILLYTDSNLKKNIYIYIGIVSCWNLQFTTNWNNINLYEILV